LICLIRLTATAHSQEALKNNLQIQTGLDLIYDDNVWQYSKRDQEDFKNNRNNPALLPFFEKTQDLDDFIWEPYLYLSFLPQGKFTQSRLFTEFSGDFYSRNTSLNFGTYRIGLEQKISDRTHASFTYTWMPRMFVGISRERRGVNLVGETVATHVKLKYKIWTWG
jgi:hypothetical protein